MIDGHHYSVGNHRVTREMTICSEEIEARRNAIQERVRAFLAALANTSATLMVIAHSLRLLRG